MSPETESSRIRAWLREASTHSLVYGLGAALQAALNFFLLPLYTSQFSVEEFGVFRMAVTAASLAGAVFYLGAYSSLSRYYFDPASPDERRAIAGTAATLTVLGAGLQVGGVLLAARPLSQAALGTPVYAPYFVLAFMTSAATFVNQIFLLMLRLNRRSTAVVVASLVSILVTAAAVLSLTLLWHRGVTGALEGLLIGQLALIPALMTIVRRHHAWGWTGPLVRAQLAFGLPAIVIGLGYYALDGADRFILARRASETDLGLYTFAYSIGLVIQMIFVQPFAQIWNPMRLEYRAQAEAGQFFALVTTYYALAGLTMVVGISLFAGEAVALLGRKAEYAAATGIIPIILLSHLTYGSINLIDTGILATNRLVYHVILLWSSFALNVALNLWWVPSFGYVGSAWATLVSYAALIAGVAIVSNRLMKIVVEPRRLAVLVVTAVGAIVVGRALPTGLAAIALKLALLAALLGLWYLVVLTTTERQWFRRVLRAAA
jgi:O-antigen/teichoic acid export membrane protein